MRALDELEALVLHELSLDQLAQRLDETTRAEPDSVEESSTRAQQLLASAKQELSQDNVSSAITALIEAVRYDPYDDTIRQTLIQALEREVDRLI